MTEWLGWQAAMARALYGPAGFFRETAPAAHFRTSVHASPLFAAAVRLLAERVDAALGRPEDFTLVDMGAGRGELLATLAADGVPGRWRLLAVEIADRPAGLDDRVGWRDAPPPRLTGLVVANEWLDNVPCEVVEYTPDGPRLVDVEAATGAERPGAVPDAGSLAWLARWWPPDGTDGTADEPDEPPARAEVGSGRDAAWADLVARLARGATVAIDYAHEIGARPRHGTLTGYRDGRLVSPVPDGSCDLTAHVALDACAAAGRAAGAETSLLLAQRDALRALGVSGARPPIDMARSDPRGYLSALARAGAAAELTDPAGLGGFTWLTQTRGIPSPLA